MIYISSYSELDVCGSGPFVCLLTHILIVLSRQQKNIHFSMLVTVSDYLYKLILAPSVLKGALPAYLYRSFRSLYSPPVRFHCLSR